MITFAGDKWKVIGIKVMENYLKYDNLYHKVSAVNLTIKDNNIIYDKYIPFAEEFAYKDIAWTEVVLIDRWRTEEKKERFYCKSLLLIKFKG